MKIWSFINLNCYQTSGKMYKTTIQAILSCVYYSIVTLIILPVQIIGIEINLFVKLVNEMI